MSKKLAFGLMRLPLKKDSDDSTNIDYEIVNQMVDRFLEEGFTYFDTAAPYHRQYSEIAFRECVAKRYPRTAYTITNKLSFFMVNQKEKLEEFFNGQLERCGVEYFDYYLLHAMNKKTLDLAEEIDAFDFVVQKQKEGKIKHIGFSFHDTAEVLEEILSKHPEMEYVQLQLNYIDWENKDVQSRACYEVALKYNKKILVMEPVKGGLLANLPEDAEQAFRTVEPNLSIASWAVRYVASLPNVVMVLSGMSTLEQMEDNISYMKNFIPLTQQEQELVRRVSEMILAKESIACTGCRYCVDDCPKKIAIPEYFKIFNNMNKFGETYKSRAKQNYEYQISLEHGRANDCIKCKKCEGHCPQHLTITSYLEDVSKALD